MSYQDTAKQGASSSFSFVKLELDNPITQGGEEYHCKGFGPFDPVMHPSITRLDVAPTRMSIASGLGQRGVVKVTFQDFDHPQGGTYWGRLLASNPYYLDRKLFFYTGFYDGDNFNFDDFNKQLYFIKKIEGPNSNGAVTITAADPLTLLDEDQSKVNLGASSKLVASLNNSEDGWMALVDNSGFSPYVFGYVLIDSELIRINQLQQNNNIDIGVAGRGQLGTKASSHEIGDIVRPVYFFNSLNVVDVIRDIIDKFTPLDKSVYIDDAEWNVERDTFLQGSLARGVLKDGDKVKEVIGDLCAEFMLSIWFDAEAQKIRLKSIGPNVSPTMRFDVGEHILGEGQQVKRDPTKAITEVIVHFGRKNLLDDGEDFSNYENHYYVPNSEASAGMLKPKTKEVYAKYIPNTGAATANRLSDRSLSQFGYGKIEYEFRLHAKDSALKVGDVFGVYTPLIQGTDGTPVPTSFIVTERDPLGHNIYGYKSVRTGFALGTPYRRIAPNSLTGLKYPDATPEQRAQYYFIAQNDGKFSNGDTGHKVY